MMMTESPAESRALTTVIALIVIAVIGYFGYGLFQSLQTRSNLPMRIEACRRLRERIPPHTLPLSITITWLGEGKVVLYRGQDDEDMQRLLGVLRRLKPKEIAASSADNNIIIDLGSSRLISFRCLRLGGSDYLSSMVRDIFVARRSHAQIQSKL